MNYIPGLNGIRAIAVLLVIISHRFPQDHFTRIFPLGNFGVDIFFVLSGFLISRILFQQLKLINAKEKTGLRVTRQFILRRVLRIFPIYYLTLFFMYFTSGIIGNDFKENFYWYALYAANYLNYIETKWFGSLAHLWSLSVEEQFYIVWPFLLYFVFKKRILLLIGLFIVIGTIYPFFFTGYSKVLTIGCINAFGLGALLAYIEIIKPNYEALFLKILNYIFLPTLLLICINYCIYKIPYFSGRLAISIIALKVIAYCRYNHSHNLIHRILENKILNFIGMISYGIYLFHNIVPRYWRFVLRKFNIDAPSVTYEFSYLEFSIQTLFIILISYISWIVIEKPTLKLKKYIKY